jgi:TRAP-type C4-dicarboxylate transport system substrate-binding protein
VFRAQTADSKKIAMDNGMSITTPDTAEFRKAMQPVYEDTYKQFPEFKSYVERIQALR